MLKRIVVASCVLLSTTPLMAQGCSDLGSAHPPFNWKRIQPLILLTEYNPWAMAIGSDSPSFALYADGTVIYWSGDRRSGEYMTATLNSSGITKLLDSAHVDKVSVLKDCYIIEDNVTDLPTNVLVVKTGDVYKTIEIYGVIRPAENIPSSRIPTSLKEALQALLSFETPTAQKWKPAYLEVILWPFSYAKSSVPWPATFPGVDDKNTQHSNSGIELFLPISDLEQYKAFVSKLRPTQAVMLDGKKWAITARTPFPHEGKP